MKKLITSILIFVFCKAHAQTFHKDTNFTAINGLTYANILLTDTANKILNLPIKMHVETGYDKQDRDNGALFVFSMYSVKGKLLFTDQILMTSSNYDAWDANEATSLYQITKNVLAGAGMQITFEP